jgi:hypothetical protein
MGSPEAQARESGFRRKSGGKFFSTDSLPSAQGFERMQVGAGRSSRTLHAGLSGADRRMNADASDIVPIAASIIL